MLCCKFHAARKSLYLFSNILPIQGYPAYRAVLQDLRQGQIPAPAVRPDPRKFRRQAFRFGITNGLGHVFKKGYLSGRFLNTLQLRA